MFYVAESGLLKFLRNFSFGIKLFSLSLILACNSQWQQSPGMKSSRALEQQPTSSSEIQDQIKKVDKNIKADLKFYFKNPEKIDYQLIKREVFEAGKCLDCHSKNSLHAEKNAILFGTDMTEYETLSFLNGIVPGFLVDEIGVDKSGNKFIRGGSKIYESVAVTQRMPPVDRGYSLLDSSRIKLLRLWILNCAPKTIPDRQKDKLLEPNSDGKVRLCLW